MVVNNEAAVSKENQEEKRKTTRFKNQSGSRMIKKKSHPSSRVWLSNITCLLILQPSDWTGPICWLISVPCYLARITLLKWVLNPFCSWNLTHATFNKLWTNS